MGIERYLSLQRSILYTLKEARERYKQPSVSIYYIANCVDEKFHTVKRHLEELKKEGRVWVVRVDEQVTYTDLPPAGRHNAR